MQRTARSAEQIRQKAVGPAVRAAGQVPRRVGPQRRDEGAVGVRTPELHPAVVGVDLGEQDGPRFLGEQQAPFGGEQAQAGPAGRPCLHGHTRPDAVVPGDVGSSHAATIVGRTGRPASPSGPLTWASVISGSPLAPRVSGMPAEDVPNGERVPLEWFRTGALGCRETIRFDLGRHHGQGTEHPR
ncbi:wolframin [Streptomyces laurentii]|uniref:Wolframin n=1 Tax=Streptomyces laurentii TaxID=39478 RepID=A0A161JG97_STRLU|nr:wolframin [Streptomyces laurentii]